MRLHLCEISGTLLKFMKTDQNIFLIKMSTSQKLTRQEPWDKFQIFSGKPLRIWFSSNVKAGNELRNSIKWKRKMKHKMVHIMKTFKFYLLSACIHPSLHHSFQTYLPFFVWQLIPKKKCTWIYKLPMPQRIGHQWLEILLLIHVAPTIITSQRYKQNETWLYTYRKKQPLRMHQLQDVNSGDYA